MKCPAILITDLKITKIIRFEEEHCHSANKGAIGVMKIKQKIKECSLQTCNNPGQIFTQAIHSVPKEVLIELPSEDSIKRSVRNQRSSSNPKNPNSPQELVIKELIMLVRAGIIGFPILSALNLPVFGNYLQKCVKKLERTKQEWHWLK
ncbi:hypothetical protein QTP88_025759 [Uroleucon formosanum]